MSRDDKKKHKKNKDKKDKPGKKAKKAKRHLTPAPLAIAPPDPAPPQPQMLTPDHGAAHRHLELARARWENGDWARLLEMDMATLETDPDRARLALILAAAHSHAGEIGQAREMAALALRWGAGRELAARVLLSSAQNSLGRVAAALREDPLAHFEAAIRLVQPHSDAPLLARNRRLRELAGLGLLPEAAGMLQQELGLLRAEGPGGDPARLTVLGDQLGVLRQTLSTVIPVLRDSPEENAPASRFNNHALALYREMDPSQSAFVYLETKSLPRSGLHFMRNSLESLLQQHFSFCEWYKQPGCCRQMPCAVTGYASESKGVPMLRMVKSHDFDLLDPVYAAEGAIRRLILVRDPLFVLTSWWALHVTGMNADLLARHGIMMNNIYFAHGSQVLQSANHIIDAEGTMPARSELVAWLKKNTAYILGFTEKWQAAAEKHPDNTRILRYQQTPEGVLDIIKPIQQHLPADALDRIAAFQASQKTRFSERADPFTSRSARVSAFLQKEADLFSEAAETIRKLDGSGLLR